MFNQGRHRLLEHSLFPALFPLSHRPADQCRVNRAPATNNCDSGRGDRSPVLLRNHTRKKRRQNKTGSDGENSALTKQTNLAEQEMYLCITLTIRQSHIICHMFSICHTSYVYIVYIVYACMCGVHNRLSELARLPPSASRKHSYDA